MVDHISDYVLLGAAHVSPVFPQFTSVPVASRKDASLFDDESRMVQHNVKDLTLGRFRDLIGADVEKDDVFFYVYGTMHSVDYRNLFAIDLKRAAPRIPPPTNRPIFDAFRNAGVQLAELHVGYENVMTWPDLTI